MTIRTMGVADACQTGGGVAATVGAARLAVLTGDARSRAPEARPEHGARGGFAGAAPPVRG